MGENVDFRLNFRASFCPERYSKKRTLKKRPNLCAVSIKMCVETPVLNINNEKIRLVHDYAVGPLSGCELSEND